ncbi:hypothetical protein BO82DRAFT_129811 [Aspergillus uvarum CBS 121591]|uniref:Uncharacterized protein n=1 Tax=Aspergillus uvarum CBS 121591 TaxID=1448315 RepID=A0A319DJK4_9EURO|nr:hypothetical protein BO82DRAFT_129811 [Aspergillus uvarum CBS 121591]PYH79632.1 hypothetical protein BO82DRAFT_129811 [Aspergillus uvarum CBS 121591]
MIGHGSSEPSNNTFKMICLFPDVLVAFLAFFLSFSFFPPSPPPFHSRDLICVPCCT